MLHINFSTSNSAFHDYGSNDLNTREIARCLEKISSDITLGRTSGKVVDYNGNIVGDWKLTNR